MMIEQVFSVSFGGPDERLIEKVIQDDNLHYLHMVLFKDEGLPEHFSNAPLYMTVLRGTLSIGLGDQQIHTYDRGSVLKIPINTKMKVNNLHDGPLELIIVKAPPPQSEQQKNQQ